MRAKRLWLALLLAGLVLTPQTLAQDNDDGFGAVIAGAWLGEGWFARDADCDGVADYLVDPEAPPPTEFVADSQSFAASGLYLATNPSNPNLGHGGWTKTGPRQVTTNNIVYLNGPDGGLLFIARIPGTFDFDKKFETATSNFGARVYLPDQDPLDPSVAPLFCTVGRHELLRKVTVTE